jgi:hypothetical protein
VYHNQPDNAPFPDRFQAARPPFLNAFFRLKNPGNFTAAARLSSPETEPESHPQSGLSPRDPRMTAAGASEKSIPDRPE